MKTAATIRSEEYSDWERNAEFYRADDHSLLMEKLAARRERYYGIRTGQRVLDIGCGTGATVSRLRARGVDAVGIDFAPAMVEAAHREYALEDHVHCAEATNLPFASSSLDAVLANGVFHHLAVQGRLGDALREIHRVLKPGGRLCCFDRNGSVISGIMSELCIRVKSALSMITRRELFPSCASRNEIAFGGRRDLKTIRDCGFRMLHRRDASSLPFFSCVVALNAIQYFLSTHLRRRIEHRLCRVVSWIDTHLAFHWLCVEQFVVFERNPLPGCAEVPSPKQNAEHHIKVAGFVPAMS
ncbi:MAG: class I SAM-dependent methyltransferase [Planctomycetes bacterium]|nr:class I SAM-dependent methyltransferase [Planctomycetota bacterium]